MHEGTPVFPLFNMRHRRERIQAKHIPKGNLEKKENRDDDDSDDDVLTLLVAQFPEK